LVQTLQEEIYSRRPKIIIDKNVIKDTNLIVEEKWFCPEIQTYFKNIGKRPAKNFLLRALILYSDFTSLRPGEEHINEFVNPEQASIYIFKPKIPVSYRYEFYYCFEINYYDEELNRSFKQAFYYHYYKARGTFEFYYCDVQEVNKIRTIINDILKSSDRDLFDN
jgi:hypothetical protein